MAKKGGKHQSKSPAEKKETTKNHKASHMLRAEKIANPQGKEIYARIKTLIDAGVKTLDIKTALFKDFKITFTVANDYIRRYRKKNKIYNYGSNNANKELEKKKQHRSFYVHDDEELNKVLDGAVE